MARQRQNTRQSLSAIIDSLDFGIQNGTLSTRHINQSAAARTLLLNSLLEELEHFNDVIDSLNVNQNETNESEDGGE